MSMTEWQNQKKSSTNLQRNILEELQITGGNNGWIPCSERLPETDEDVLCWYEYFRYGEYNQMYQTYGIGHYWKPMNVWGGEVSNGHKCRVIAWQPLPAPYQPKGE